MARRANLSDAEEEGAENPINASAARTAQSHVDLESLSPSPVASFSSDKENRRAAQAGRLQQSKGKARATATPRISVSAAAEREVPRSNKRRKLSDRNVLSATQSAHEKRLAEASDTRFYDPDQNIEERRAVRKELRDLSRELTDSRAEYLTPGSKGLVDTLHKANGLFTSVKQTSDATLDSRVLVSTADLSAKRTTQLNLGDSSIGIDVDDFVGKCITYMRRGSDRGSSSTQRRRNHDDSDEDGAGEGFDEGDEFNWEWLGSQACFPNNVRPPVPGFLLGPLSVQRKARKATQRRERLQKRDPREAVRPEEVKAQDITRNENANLTTLCKNIRELLVKTIVEGTASAEKEEIPEDIPMADLRAIMIKHKIADDMGVPFFHFVVNPRSFGQTVENLFYVSFLIRDGTAGLGNDSSMLPTLHATQARTASQIQEENISKHQAIFHLDFETWEAIIDAYDIKESIIPHRQTDEEAHIGASGWYG